jgi:hypothetical protein
MTVEDSPFLETLPFRKEGRKKGRNVKGMKVGKDGRKM